MEQKNTAEFDFDAWSDMAKNDPETFEKMRLAAIEDVIEKAPEDNRERLRRLQWRIDQERRLARTPMAACLRISRMMWRMVLGEGGLNDRFAELQGLVNGHVPETPARRPMGGEVVAFARAQD